MFAWVFKLFCCPFFFSFYFLNALQSDINNKRVCVLGHEYVLGPSQAHFSSLLVAWARMSLSRAQNIFMPANINTIFTLSQYLTGNYFDSTPRPLSDYIFAHGWVTSMGLVGTPMALDHSILINFLIKVGLTWTFFLLPPPLSIVFVSRTSRHVFDWFYGSTRKV